MGECCQERKESKERILCYEGAPGGHILKLCPDLPTSMYNMQCFRKWYSPSIQGFSKTFEQTLPMTSYVKLTAIYTQLQSGS